MENLFVTTTTTKYGRLEIRGISSPFLDKEGENFSKQITSFHPQKVPKNMQPPPFWALFLCVPAPIFSPPLKDLLGEQRNSQYLHTKVVQHVSLRFCFDLRIQLSCLRFSGILCHVIITTIATTTTATIRRRAKMKTLI